MPALPSKSQSPTNEETDKKYIVLAVNFLASWLRVASDPVEREKRYAASSASSAASATALTSTGEAR